MSSIDLKQVWISAAAEAPMVLRLVGAEHMASELVVELAVSEACSGAGGEVSIGGRTKPRYGIRLLRPSELR